MQLSAINLTIFKKNIIYGRKKLIFSNDSTKYWIGCTVSLVFYHSTVVAMLYPLYLLANLPLSQAWVSTCVSLNVTNAGTKTASVKEIGLCALIEH